MHSKDRNDHGVEAEIQSRTQFPDVQRIDPDCTVFISSLWSRTYT